MTSAPEADASYRRRARGGVGDCASRLGSDSSGPCLPWRRDPCHRRRQRAGSKRQAGADPMPDDFEIKLDGQQPRPDRTAAYDKSPSSSRGHRKRHQHHDPAGETTNATPVPELRLLLMLDDLSITPSRGRTCSFAASRFVGALPLSGVDSEQQVARATLNPTHEDRPGGPDAVLQYTAGEFIDSRMSGTGRDSGSVGRVGGRRDHVEADHSARLFPGANCVTKRHRPIAIVPNRDRAKEESEDARQPVRIAAADSSGLRERYQCDEGGAGPEATGDRVRRAGCGVARATDGLSARRAGESCKAGRASRCARAKTRSPRASKTAPRWITRFDAPTIWHSPEDTDPLTRRPAATSIA